MLIELPRPDAYHFNVISCGVKRSAIVDCVLLVEAVVTIAIFVCVLL